MQNPPIMKLFKQIRKKIESEMIVSITGLLTRHDAGITKVLIKPIKLHSNQLAKKYVKALKVKEKELKKSAKKKLEKIKAAPAVAKKAIAKAGAGRKRTVKRK